MDAYFSTNLFYCLFLPLRQIDNFSSQTVGDMSLLRMTLRTVRSSEGGWGGT